MKTDRKNCIHFSAMIGCLFSRLSPSSLTSLDKDPLETAVFLTPSFEFIPIPASLNALAIPLPPNPVSGLDDFGSERLGCGVSALCLCVLSSSLVPLIFLFLWLKTSQMYIKRNAWHMFVLTTRYQNKLGVHLLVSQMPNYSWFHQEIPVLVSNFTCEIIKMR